MGVGGGKIHKNHHGMDQPSRWAPAGPVWMEQRSSDQLLHLSPTCAWAALHHFPDFRQHLRVTLGDCGWISLVQLVLMRMMVVISPPVTIIIVATDHDDGGHQHQLSRNGFQKLSGEYQLSTSHANGHPLWQRAGWGEEAYLYSGRSGKWCLGSTTLLPLPCGSVPRKRVLSKSMAWDVEIENLWIGWFFSDNPPKRSTYIPCPESQMIHFTQQFAVIIHHSPRLRPIGWGFSRFDSSFPDHCSPYRVSDGRTLSISWNW